MQIETWLSPAAVATHERRRAAVAVVVDVIRATTVITTAIAAGARSVTTCASIEQAHGIKQAAAPNDPPLLCGERACRTIEGFDYGNSPAEYAPAGVSGRDLVMTTTNGTLAIEAASDCDAMFIACFANLSAVADAMIAQTQATAESNLVRIVCAGTNGAISAEDVLLAGALINVCHRKLSDSSDFYNGPIELLNDSATIALAAWQHCITHDKVTCSETLTKRLMWTQGGRNLIEAGFGSDLVECGSIDVFDSVPRRDRLTPARFIGYNR